MKLYMLSCKNCINSKYNGIFSPLNLCLHVHLVCVFFIRVFPNGPIYRSILIFMAQIKHLNIKHHLKTWYSLQLLKYNVHIC